VEPLPTLRVECVAVIGAGPSGLTAALELRKRGYGVTVFEELPEAGGMLRYGIPAYRLPRHVLDEEIDRILGTGIELHANTRVGRDVTFAQIDRDFDAIFIAVGAHRSLPLGVPGEEVSGVHGAVEWLRAYNTTGTAPIGNRVAVIGGGNSAVDAARTAKRLGAESVTVYYRRMRADMPAQQTEIHAAEEEGIEIVELVAPAAVTAANGSVGGLQMRRMELRGFDRSGRKRPVAIPGSEFAVAVDTVLSAIGQTPALDFLGSARVRASEVTIEVDKDLRTTNSKVWAGGDAVTGPAMVIDAIRAGQRAARAIDASIREAAGEQPWMAPDDERIEIPVDLVGTDDEAAERPPAAMPAADPTSRRHDFREVELGYSLELAMADAARCMRCDLTTKEVLAVRIEEREAVAPRCGTEQAKSERS